MNSSRIPSLLLAVVLQVLPVTRVFVATSTSAGSSFAFVSTWLAGLGALLGSYNAVSGASTTITSPSTATATNGVAFMYRVTTGPDAANWFAASNLPPGLVISRTVGRITGTPTADGVWAVLLTASDDQRPDRTVRKTLTLTVKPAGGGIPVITAQPQTTRVVEGAPLTLSVTASGPAPLRYIWRKGGAQLAGETNQSLTIGSVTTNDAGSYNVLVASSFGVAASSNAVVSVLSAPRFTSYLAHDGIVDLSFVRESGAVYDVEFKDAIDAAAWQQWTNWTPSATTTLTTLSAPAGDSVSRFYHIKMILP